MSPSAKSVFIYGIYLALIGLMLLLVPNVLLSLFGIEPTHEVWIRFEGILLMATAVYYFIAAKYELILILKTTAFIRFTVIVFFSAFVLLDLVSPRIIIIAVIDFLGGTWTYLLLKKEGHFYRNKNKLP
ncbi:conserved hypothetical membrane protein [Formosa agariphila KMM 3901]|uniref:Conserved hypothetical membrane protein n=1 Tax=Formosa agariphila (strain DSM 15362 / KCTC 12365 / LMG 23005 / KMM 3901 / M-2Alg 35-1) TaxID=1347342 RepID=T2KL85_FORAG|nr:hypothetical protein [Formosa agariphila]CDF79500.1 conserved hypothetical membrane protein [Formosa agariphila KMM 3901]